MKTVKEVLQAAKAQISTRDKWEKNGRYAVNKNGTTATPTSPDACKWCAYGAIEAQLASEWVKAAAFKALRRALLALHPRSKGYVATYNDNPRTSHPAIMRLYDKAIGLADGQ